MPEIEKHLYHTCIGPRSLPVRLHGRQKQPHRNTIHYIKVRETALDCGVSLKQLGWWGTGPFALVHGDNIWPPNNHNVKYQKHKTKQIKNQKQVLTGGER